MTSLCNYSVEHLKTFGDKNHHIKKENIPYLMGLVQSSWTMNLLVIQWQRDWYKCYSFIHATRLSTHANIYTKVPGIKANQIQNQRYKYKMKNTFTRSKLQIQNQIRTQIQVLHELKRILFHCFLELLPKLIFWKCCFEAKFSGSETWNVEIKLPLILSFAAASQKEEIVFLHKLKDFQKISYLNSVEEVYDFLCHLLK